MPLKVVATCPPVMPVTITVRNAHPSSAASDSAYVTQRVASFRNRSTTRIAQPAASRKISGYASSMTGRPVSIFARLSRLVSQLARRDVLEQVVDRRVHDLRERSGMHAQPQHGDREQPEHQQPPPLGGGKLRDPPRGHL